MENGPKQNSLSFKAVNDMEVAYLYIGSNAARRGDIVDTPQADQGPGRVSPEFASARNLGLYTKEPRWHGERGRS